MRLKINIFLAFILFLTNVTCSQGENSAQQFREDSIAKADSIKLARANQLTLEQARRDSIDKIALKDDSLMERHIVIDKENYLLYVLENGETLMRVPVCLGKNRGQKQRKGDHKTPEGNFNIISIEDPTYWTYDFHDGRGKVMGTYGPYFFRLNTPQSRHIGIHGTSSPESMGTRGSDGCIRLRNEDLETLRQYIKIGMKVRINPDNV